MSTHGWFQSSVKAILVASLSASKSELGVVGTRSENELDKYIGKQLIHHERG